MKFSNSEEVTKRYVESNGYRVERFSKKEMRTEDNKTPDFKVYRGEDLSFYCEVKEIEDFPIEDYNGNIEFDKDEDKVHGLINKSCNHFLSVNPKHTVPNVLAIYNKRLGTDILDFKFAFEGKWITKGGSIYQRPNTAAYRRIETKKVNIDLCLWYDENMEKFTWMYLEDSIFLDKIKSLFSSES